MVHLPPRLPPVPATEPLPPVEPPRFALMTGGSMLTVAVEVGMPSGELVLADDMAAGTPKRMTPQMRMVPPFSRIFWIMVLFSFFLVLFSTCSQALRRALVKPLSKSYGTGFLTSSQQVLVYHTLATFSSQKVGLTWDYVSTNSRVSKG